VEDIAHEGFKSDLKWLVLTDPKGLFVLNLEGFNGTVFHCHYFKFEIGHKLLDHFCMVINPQMLQVHPSFL